MTGAAALIHPTHIALFVRLAGREALTTVWLSAIFWSDSFTNDRKETRTVALRRVTPQSRTDAVIEALSAFVEAAGLRPGDRFPSERELAEQLGVSRPILREGLRHLAALRVIESRTGSGTYLLKALSPSDRHVVLQLESERQGLLQVLQLRRALESEAAALVALHGIEADIAELSGLVDQLESDFLEYGDNPDADKAFHLALYRLSGNPLMRQLMEPIWETFERFWQHPLGKEAFARRSFPLHRRIFDAIRTRNARAARELVVQMLDIVEEDLRA